MKFIRPLAFASALAFFGFPAWAEEAHHPKTAASAAKEEPKAVPGNIAAKEPMTKMDDKMKAMGEMHEKMMNAKTPEERRALMAEHRKSMQGGMSTMGCMDGAGKNSMKGGQHADMATRHRMMEKRMDMMEAMMQMMMDRLPAPAK